MMTMSMIINHDDDDDDDVDDDGDDDDDGDTCSLAWRVRRPVGLESLSTIPL